MLENGLYSSKQINTMINKNKSCKPFSLITKSQINSLDLLNVLTYNNSGPQSLLNLAIL